MNHPPLPEPGFLRLIVEAPLLTRSFIPPKLLFNGHQVPLKFGPNVIPAPPGRAHLEVYCVWMRRYGQAHLDVDLYPGRESVVFYTTPAHQFSRGAIGFQPQPQPGRGVSLGCLAALFALLIAFIVVIVILAITAGAS